MMTIEMMANMIDYYEDLIAYICKVHPECKEIIRQYDEMLGEAEE